jgi:hypothetical protein
MSESQNRIIVRKLELSEGATTRFGPIDPSNGTQLSMPKRFEREVIHTDDEMTLHITCLFSGEWVKVEKLCVTASPNVELNSRYLLQLALPSIVRSVTVDAIPNSSYWLDWKADDRDHGGRRMNHAFLAQLYWLEHVSQGNPRQSLMRYLAMPRSTCNVLIRQLRTEYPLPRPRTESKPV